jgi:hypothetical protein
MAVVRTLLMATAITMQSYVDFYELSAPVVETYRRREISPRMTIALDIEYNDSEPPESDRAERAAPSDSSDRWHRARCWTSDD